MRPAHRAHHGVRAAVVHAQQAAQARGDVGGRLAQGLDVGQRQREVAAVQAAHLARGQAARRFHHRGGGVLQQAVGGRAAQRAVQRLQLDEAHHHQRAAGRAVLGVEHHLHAAQEVSAVGQPRERIAMGLPAQQLHLAGLLVEHRLHAPDHRVHRAGDVAQLGHVGLVDGDEAALGDRLGLVHGAQQRNPDAVDADGGEDAGRHDQHQQHAHGVERALPELVVGERRLAAHLEAAELVPAVADLGDAVCGREAQQPDEPAGRVLRMGVGLLLDDRLAVRPDKADALVVAGVELARDGQLPRRLEPARVGLQLRQRQRERLRGVVVLHDQLGLEIVARRVDGHADGARERQHQRHRQQQPHLADQRHAYSSWPTATDRLPRSIRRYFIGTHPGAPARPPRAISTGAPTGLRWHGCYQHPATNLRH